MLMLALGILIATGITFVAFARVFGEREFTAPERPSSPRQYWG